MPESSPTKSVRRSTASTGACRSRCPPKAFPANASVESDNKTKRGQKAPKDNKTKRMLEDGAPVTFDELRQVQAQHAVAATLPVLADGQLSKMWQAMPRADAPGLTRDHDWPTRDRHCTGFKLV